VPESDANQEYFASQHMAMLASGTDPWQAGETPNEKLLKIARKNIIDREQSKRKLAVIGKKRQSRCSYAIWLHLWLQVLIDGDDGYCHCYCYCYFYCH
jgi:hypothetical protein